MSLKDKRILALVHEDFEDSELIYPIYRLAEEGIRVTLAGEKAKEPYHGKYGIPVVSDLAYGEVDPADYDGLVIPGGWAPDRIRRYPEALDIVKYMDDHSKPIAQICHAGWVAVSAGILKGRKVTSVPAIKDDMINAGAQWVDQEVVRDRNLVSSRRPPDLPAYMRTFIQLLREG